MSIFKRKLESKDFIYLDLDWLLQQNVLIPTSTVKEKIAKISGHSVSPKIKSLLKYRTVETSELCHLLDEINKLGANARKAFSAFLYNRIMPKLKTLDLTKDYLKVVKKGAYCEYTSKISAKKTRNVVVQFSTALIKDTQFLFLNFPTKTRFEIVGYPYQDHESEKPIFPLLAKGKMMDGCIFMKLHCSGKSYKDFCNRWPQKAWPGVVKFFTVEGKVIEYDKSGVVPCLELTPVAIYK
jgi:hypothetical protein